jgi:hypothetical protein
VRNGVVQRDLVEVKSKMDGGELIKVALRRGKMGNWEKALTIPAHELTCRRSHQTGSRKVNKTKTSLRKCDDN